MIQTALDQSMFVRAAVDGVIHEAILAGLPDRADDPAVPRQLAQHADHRGLDPAVDPHLHHHPVRAGRDHQHHDARRAGARGRASWWTTPPWRSRTSTSTWSRARASSRRSSTARSRSPFRPSCPRCASASCSCRCSCSPAWRAICSCRWPMAVVFAMLASYFFSRTLVPTLAKYLLRGARARRAGCAGPLGPDRAHARGLRDAASPACARAIVPCWSAA